MSRSVAFKILRAGVSAGIIIYLVVRLDISEIAAHLRSIKVLPLLLAAAADFLMIAANALRWKALLRAKGILLSLGKLTYLYLVGIFFSAFLPTSVGGDVMRIVGVGNLTGRRADAFASVVVERLLGFFVLIPICLIAIPFVAGEIENEKSILAVGFIGLLVFIAAFLLLLRPVARQISRALGPLFSLLGRFRLKERLERAYEAVVMYRDSKGVLLLGLVLSVASRLIWVLGCYLVAQAFSLEISFKALLVVVPIVELVRVIPISLSGIGVREAAFVAMLAQFGVDENLAFAYGLVVYIVFLGFSVLGGVMYAMCGLGGDAAPGHKRQGSA